jgi:hypothetical protein
MNWIASATMHGYWPLALAFIALILFAIPEWAAIKFGGQTFSAFMAKTANAGPFGKIWTGFWFMMFGGLAVHFLGWCVSCTGG